MPLRLAPAGLCMYRHMRQSRGSDLKLVRTLLFNTHAVALVSNICIVLEHARSTIQRAEHVKLEVWGPCSVQTSLSRL
jgi:hypothetical protein